jgi:hypothetical protein
MRLRADEAHQKTQYQAIVLSHMMEEARPHRSRRVSGFHVLSVKDPVPHTPLSTEDGIGRVKEAEDTLR